MGVSFKIARTGSRYRRRLPPADPAADEEVETETEGREVSLLSLGDDIVNHSSFPDKGGNNCVEQEPETSFALNLLPSGFSIVKPTEDMPFPFLGDVHKLHPYDRASQALFSAIENGWLPGNILDDIPCKYLNGNVVCEVRDYRSCITKFGGHDPSGDELPKVQKVTLRMCSENVVNDLLSISDDTWTYNDLLRAEAQIIKALQPKLHLDPKPSMEKLCGKPFLKQLDLGIYKRRSRGKQQGKPDTNHVFALDVSNNEVVKNSNSKQCIVFRDRGVQSAPFTISLDMPYTKKNNLVASCSLSVPSSGAAISRSDPKRTIRGSCITLESSTLSNIKRSLSVAESSLISVKRAKQEPREMESSCVNVGQRNMQFGQESQCRMILLQNNCEASNLHCPNPGDQHFPQENYLTSTGKMSKQGTQKLAELCQQELKRVIKEEPTGTRISYNPAKKVIDGHAIDISLISNNRSSQKKSLSDTRSSRPHLQCRSDILHDEKCPKKDNSYPKRKSSACPQASVGCSDNCPVPQLGGNERASSVSPSGSSPIVAAVELQKDKTASVPLDSIKKLLNSASNIPSVQNNNLPLQKQKKPNADIQVASNSAKLGFSAGTSDACFLTDSSSVGNTSMQPFSGANDDHALHNRFSKILMVTQRHGLNKNKKRADKYPTTKSISHCTVPPIEFLKPEDAEECQSLTDGVCMSKYLIGGSRNACKTRTLTFLRVRFFFTGSGIPFLVNESRCKLVLFQSEEPDKDEVGVTIVYGDEEKLFRIAPLPTPHHADLFAAQFTLLMERDGYKLVNDLMQLSSSSPTGSAPSDHLVDIDSPEFTQLQCVAPTRDHLLNMVVPYCNKLLTSNMLQFPSQNIISPIMIRPSVLNFTRHQQLETASNKCSSNQQNHACQSSLSTVPNNLLGNVNMHKGYVLSNSSSDVQILHLQQQSQDQQFQQQSILKYKAASLGVSNSITGFGRETSRSNLLQTSNPLKFSGFSHAGQQFLNRGTLQAQAALLPYVQTNSQGMHMMNYSVPLSLPYCEGLAGDGSLLEQGLGRSYIGQLRPRGRASMVPPDREAMNTNKFDLLQQLCAQQKVKSHQPLQLKQKLPSGSPLQQDSSSLAQVTPCLQVTQKQMVPASVSHEMNAGISDIGSPQMSSHTFVSGGSITSLPTELPASLKDCQR